MKKRQLIIQVFILALVFIFFAFFRFYNLDKRIIFDWDQEQFSTQIKNIVVNHKLTLLGPRVVSDTGFFLAPYFTYLLIPLYLIFNLHPSALIWFIVLFDTLFFFVSFLVIKKIFGKEIAFPFLALWSFNYLLVGYDTIPWWPITIPLGVILAWRSLFEIYKNNSFKGWIFLGATLGLFANMHFQFVFIIAFSLFFLFINLLINKKHKLDLKKFFLFLAVFLMFFTPILLFDLRHDFLNIKLFVNFFFSKEANGGRDIWVWITVFSNFIDSIVYYRSTVLAQIFYFVFLLIILFLAKKKKDFSRVFYLALVFLWLAIPISFMFYGKRPSEYYFVFLYPFIFIVLADFFAVIKKYVLLIVLVLVLIALNFKKAMDALQPNIFGLYYKDQTIRLLKEKTDGKKFNISFATPLGANFGYRYLIDYYGIKQTGNFKDPLVQIRIPPIEDDLKVQEIGIKLPKEFK